MKVAFRTFQRFRFLRLLRLTRPSAAAEWTAASSGRKTLIERPLCLATVAAAFIECAITNPVNIGAVKRPQNEDWSPVKSF
jgi:hypothetical protein